MVPGAFSVVFDHEQTRVQRHPVFASINGLGWDGRINSNTWLDPVTHTLMVRPMCKYSGWQGESTGIYAKPTGASYDYETSANWEEFEVYDGGGASFIQGADTTNPGWIKTATAPGKNRGVNLAFFGYGAGDAVEIAQFGWHDTNVTAATSTVGGIIYSDGTVVVYKGGVIVGDGKIGLSVSGAKDVPVEVLLLPMRRRELLVLGASDTGFVVVFDDIDEGATAPEIVPASKFWFEMSGAATRAQVQISPCKFETSGYANSVLVNFQRPPKSGASLRNDWVNPVFTSITNANLYGDTAFAGTTNVTSVALVEDDGSTAFVADGTLNTARVKVTLSSDGSYTPFVYGAVMQFPGTTALTNDTEEADLDDYLYSLSLEVGDAPFETSWRAVYRFPVTAEATVAKLLTVGNRPVKVLCGTLVMLDGRAGEPHYVQSTQDECSYVAFDLFDMSQQLSEFVFRDEFPLDGFKLSYDVASASSAVAEVARLAGIQDADMDFTSDTFKVPEIPGKICEEFSYPVPVGENAKEAIEGLHSAFAAGWYVGVRPTATSPALWFKSPADMGTTPVLTVYETNADAVAASAPNTQVYMSYTSQTEAVNANEIWVTGQDSRTGNVIQSYLVDEASQDATTVPSLRPDNWLGVPKIYGVQDPRFRTQDSLERAVGLLATAVTSKRTLGQFDTAEMLWWNSDPGVTDLMLPVWRGDYVTLDGKGDVLLTSLRVDVVRNASGNFVTSASYTFGGFTDAGGSSLASIQASNQAKYDMAGRYRFLGLGSHLWVKRTRTEAP